jgi:hypothetical protein
MIAMVLLCVSCVDENFNPNIDATEDVIIANEIETNIKATGVVYKEVEAISEKMKLGQAIGVLINQERNEWEYTFDTDLLSGKIVVAYSEQNPDSEVRTVDCSKLKIHYYENIWILLFGTIALENIKTLQESKKYNIQTTKFGYADIKKSKTSNIAENSDYFVDYNFPQENVSAKLAFSGSSNGQNQSSGAYKQKIIKDIVIDLHTLKIIDGKMNIIIDRYGENFPIEVEYSKSGRTVKYRGNEQTTSYDN